MSRGGAKCEDAALPTPPQIQGRCLEEHEGKVKERWLPLLWSVRICYLFGEDKDCYQVGVKRGEFGFGSQLEAVKMQTNTISCSISHICKLLWEGRFCFN